MMFTHILKFYFYNGKISPKAVQPGCKQTFTHLGRQINDTRYGVL